MSLNFPGLIPLLVLDSTWGLNIQTCEGFAKTLHCDHTDAGFFLILLSPCNVDVLHLQAILTCRIAGYKGSDPLLDSLNPAWQAPPTMNVNGSPLCQNSALVAVRVQAWHCYNLCWFCT